MSPPDVRSGPQVVQPGNRPQSPALAKGTVRSIVTDDGVVAVDADLIADRGDLERQAYERGRLDGFADGWRCGLEAGAERGRAA